MRFHVSIREQKDGWTKIHHVECASRKNAIALVCALATKGIKADLLWSPDSAAELARETSRGYAWAKRLWHWERVPMTHARIRAARRWSRLVMGR